MKSNVGNLRDEVRKLADEAFHRNLISGHGDSEYSNEYQIVLDGKPKHYPLRYAHAFLEDLLEER
ncbi:MAG: hypothetical protein HC866_26860 [Leptolyngbyaceae cyanobacterium RU_5_1]|nr:hypothetical protein [Leptolyngbyaceae cyanobacterium RU_5_1]